MSCCGSKTIDYYHDCPPKQQVLLLKQLLCWLKLVFAVMVVGVALFLCLLIGLAASGSQLTATSQATVAMHEKMVDTENQVRSLLSDYTSALPQGQVQVTMDQLLDIVNKMHTISGQVVVLLGAGEQLVETAKEDDLVQKGNEIMTNIDELTQALVGVAEAFASFRLTFTPQPEQNDAPEDSVQNALRILQQKEKARKAQRTH